MAKVDLTSYRDNVSNQVESIDKDIDTSLSYISIGAGFQFIGTLIDRLLMDSAFCPTRTGLHLEGTIIWDEESDWPEYTL